MWTIEDLWVVKDYWRCISGKSEPFLTNFVAVLWMDLMPLSEIGSTVRKNLDDGTT